MIRRLVVFSALLLFSATTMATVCVLTGATQIPANSTFAIGPTVSTVVTADPNIMTAIVNAYDAWDGTDAVNRIGNWDNTVTTNDCPAGQPSQIGAFDFSATPACATNTAYSIGSNVLAYVDYYATQCAQCGTLSISVNLNFAWSLNPLPGEYDIQGVLAHEFGHVLGFAHQRNGVCTSITAPTCAATPGRETMGSTFSPVETCERTIEPNDEESADWLY
jgi:hypothetical protein